MKEQVTIGKVCRGPLCYRFRLILAKRVKHWSRAWDRKASYCTLWCGRWQGWPQKVVCRSQTYSARGKLMLISDEARDLKRFPFVGTGRPDQSVWNWKRLFLRVFAEKTTFFRAYYSGFNWSGWIVLIKSKILVTTERVCQICSDKWKAPLVDYICQMENSLGCLHPGSGGGGSTPANFGWGCAARFAESWPYFRPRNVIFHTRFQTRPLKPIPVFRPGIQAEIVINTQIRAQTKTFFKSTSNSCISHSYLLIWNWIDKSVHTLP